MDNLSSVAEEVRRLRHHTDRHGTLLREHVGLHAEYGARLIAMEDRADALTARQVDLASKKDLETQTQLLTLKLDHLKALFDPIQKGIYWVIGLVLTGVIGAILALVLRKP